MSVLSSYGTTDLLNYLSNKIVAIVYNLNGSDVKTTSIIKVVNSTSIEFHVDLDPTGTYQDFRYLDANGNTYFEKIATLTKDSSQGLMASLIINIGEVIS